jgi:predicted negative regulator of RcsB-dependent stress response
MTFFDDPVISARYNEFIMFITKHKNIIVSFVAAIFLLTASFFGYKYYINKLEEQAHQEYTHLIKFVDEKVSNTEKIEKKEEKWKAVIDKAEEAYIKNSNSALSSMFLAVKSNAFLQVGNIDEAIKHLNVIINKIKNAQLKQFYELKRALLQLDSQKETTQKEGLSVLTSYAQSHNQVTQALAFYYLGFYHWTKQNFKETRNYWQQFIIKYDGQKGLSDLVQDVKDKFDLITV